jgi:hypothetical protein
MVLVTVRTRNEGFMDRLRFKVLVVVLAVVGFGSSALAQSDTVVVSGSTLEVLRESQAASRIAQLERAYDRVNLTRARTMIGVSAVLLAGGAGMIAAGESFFRNGLGSLANGDAATSNGLTTLGSLMIVGSTIGLVIASRRLKKKKAERRHLQGQLTELERSRQVP